MLYRRYFATCSLLLVTGIVLLLIRRTTRTGERYIPIRKDYYGPRLRTSFQWAKVTTQKTSVPEPATEQPEQPTTLQSRTIRVADILRNQTKLIEEEMNSYLFPDPNRRFLSDYVPAKGGRPMNYFMLSTWESRYPFIGRILNTLPGNFYIEEPLRRFGIQFVNSSTDAQRAVKQLRNVMDCNFNEAPNYMEDISAHPDLIHKNQRLWLSCRIRGGKYCYSEEFLRAFCLRFPIKTMNVIRLRLRDMADWLADSKNSDVRIVLLVRDPRALMQSRRNKRWCKKQPDCEDVTRVCQFMMDDYVAYTELSIAYPGRLTVLRFEDLALDPFRETRKLADFLRAPYTRKTDEFLQLHTIPSNTTVRQLREQPFAWMTRLAFERIEEIQRECLNVTTAWGYQLVTSPSALSDPQFVPLTALPDNYN